MTAWLDDLLAAIPVHLRQRRLLLALSGGLDSSLLLYGLQELRQAGELGRVEALHVHHGLQPDAEAWVAHVQDYCTRLDVPLQVLRVQVQRAGGRGLEAAAREARYAALTRAMQAGDVLLTAHHQDDQAETFLLQLMRGAGVRGLSAMPALTPLALPDGVGWHLRPWLGVSRSSLHELALAHDVHWVDDPSNQDVRLARNSVRHSVMPALQAHWPQAAQTLARCAQRMATTEGLLFDLARLDLEQARTENAERLLLEPLRRLSLARLHNAIRAWLLELELPSPPEARLRELSRVLAAREDALPRLIWPGGELRRWRGALYAMTGGQSDELAWPGRCWKGNEPLHIPELGLRLYAQPSLGRGLRASLFAQGVRVCVRHADSLPPAASRVSLGKRLQELGVPPWRRGRIPLLFHGDELLQIVDRWGGGWISPHARAGDDEDGFMIVVGSMTGVS
ncbi:MAG: tRNA lysidine(34) synthetase TilS [Pseudomonadota bacterium]